MNINRIFKIIVPFILFNSFIFGENYKVEVGIESITRNNGKYNISVYIINLYVPIAGIQFKIIPSDIFSIEEIYGGKAIDAGFQIHKNKKGIILGFSMSGNTIPPAVTTAGLSRFKDNIALNIVATSNEIPTETMLEMECVMASKSGESLSTKFIPFDLSNISYLDVFLEDSPTNLEK